MVKTLIYEGPSSVLNATELPFVDLHAYKNILQAMLDMK